MPEGTFSDVTDLCMYLSKNLASLVVHPSIYLNAFSSVFVFVCIEARTK